MTRDEMIDMAVSVGLLRRGDVRVEPDTWGLTEVRRFASLVAQAERKACAELCDAIKGVVDPDFPVPQYEAGCCATAEYLAKAIRERGSK